MMGGANGTAKQRYGVYGMCGISQPIWVSGLVHANAS